MSITRILRSKLTPPFVATTLARAASATRNATPVATTSLWEGAVALVDHPSDAPPA